MGSWDYWSRYQAKRWKPFEAVDNVRFYLNYNGCGHEKGVIKTYKVITGSAKRRHESAEREVA